MTSPRPRRQSPVAITAEHIAEIRRLSALDVLQNDIARRLGISASSVARVQAREGIGHLSREAGRAAAMARRGEIWAAGA